MGVTKLSLSAIFSAEFLEEIKLVTIEWKEEENELSVLSFELVDGKKSVIVVVGRRRLALGLAILTP